MIGHSVLMGLDRHYWSDTMSISFVADSSGPVSLFDGEPSRGMEAITKLGVWEFYGFALSNTAGNEV
jgi:hypothetical protein